MKESPEHGFFIDDGDGYYKEFDDYFVEYADDNGDLEAVEVVCLAKPVEIKLDAAEIVNNWEEALRLECDCDLVDRDQINELQSILDAWCERQPSKCYVGDIGAAEIPVPWCEWFGVEERGNSDEQ